jgi:branched-subunit amino acid transport protein AzlD
MDLMVIAVMGSWLLKMVLVLLVIVAIKDADFYHRGVMFGATAVAVVGSVLIDLQTVATARIPHVRP